VETIAQQGGKKDEPQVGGVVETVKMLGFPAHHHSYERNEYVGINN
jgi:hypothetical protein